MLNAISIPVLDCGNRLSSAQPSIVIKSGQSTRRHTRMNSYLIQTPRVPDPLATTRNRYKASIDLPSNALSVRSSRRPSRNESVKSGCSRDGASIVPRLPSAMLRLMKKPVTETTDSIAFMAKFKKYDLLGLEDGSFDDFQDDEGKDTDRVYYYQDEDNTSKEQRLSYPTNLLKRRSGKNQPLITPYNGVKKPKNYHPRKLPKDMDDPFERWRGIPPDMEIKIHRPKSHYQHKIPDRTESVKKQRDQIYHTTIERREQKLMEKMTHRHRRHNSHDAVVKDQLDYAVRSVWRGFIMLRRICTALKVKMAHKRVEVKERDRVAGLGLMLQDWRKRGKMVGKWRDDDHVRISRVLTLVANADRGVVMKKVVRAAATTFKSMAFILKLNEKLVRKARLIRWVIGRFKKHMRIRKVYIDNFVSQWNKMLASKIQSDFSHGKLSNVTRIYLMPYRVVHRIAAAEFNREVQVRLPAQFRGIRSNDWFTTTIANERLKSHLRAKPVPIEQPKVESPKLSPNSKSRGRLFQNKLMVKKQPESTLSPKKVEQPKKIIQPEQQEPLIKPFKQENRGRPMTAASKLSLSKRVQTKGSPPLSQLPKSSQPSNRKQSELPPSQISTASIQITDQFSPEVSHKTLLQPRSLLTKLRCSIVFLMVLIRVRIDIDVLCHHTRGIIERKLARKPWHMNTIKCDLQPADVDLYIRVASLWESQNQPGDQVAAFPQWKLKKQKSIHSRKISAQIMDS